uniref:Rho/Rac guanine nucleotide exchange factor 18 n=1 Tax=Callorhinchus milii TaxID=7868 RepID=A0A4W3HH65_CALMI
MPSPTQCGNPETRSHSLSGVEEMYFSHMAEGKDDTFLDGDDSATDVSSSVEDIPFLDSSIQGLSGFSLDPQSQGASSSEDITASRPPDRAGTHTHTYPGALPVTMEADDSWPQRDADGCNDTDPPADERPGSSWDTDNELDAESQDIVPLLIRSMSTSRRYSWEGPLSPSAMGGMRRRLSLDVLGIDSDGEGDQEDEEQDNLSQDQGSFSFPEFRPVTEGEADGDGTTTPPESMEDEQDQEHGAMHLRTETVFTNGSKTAQGRFPRKVACVQVGATDSGIDKDPRAEKENLEPNHLLVQQVLQELKAFHGLPRCPVKASQLMREGNAVKTSLAQTEEGNKSERPERGTKVKRTLSSLKNRMTGSFKDKGKSKDREREKESPKEKRKSNSGHELMPGTFSSLTNCTVCSKPLTSRNGYQCVNCAVNVHKNCRTLLTECPGRNKKHPVTSPSSQRPPSAFLRESQRSAHPSSDGNTGAVRSLGMTILPGGASQPALSSTSSVSGLTLAEMEQEVENGVPRSKPWPEDSLGAREPSVESLVVEDMVFAPLKRELEADGQDMEAESWSLAVESAYAKTQSKETTKRQDVIYELMQTEMHHIRTLKIMVGVYSRGLREELQVDVDRIFPCLDDLLKIHSEFFSQLRERRRDSLEDGSDRNYLIRRIGDLLVQQFSGERGERMRDKYGTFCSRHNEATNYYKEQFQSNKKFQSLIKKLSNCPVVRRLGVQECVLLVTQRITKYPVLVERIILNTTAGSEEHTELTLALCRIKETLACVDTMVNEYEKSQRLKEIVRRMEIKSVTKLKNGTIFRRHDMLRGKLRLLHEGVVCWKAASGRLKDILALVLSDVIVLLQEKDQKYSFATVDQKPAGISLYKLIVRKVANEEKGMFLISASDEGPEMYEIHTNSKEERNTWMAIIREARLNAKDEQIKTSLNEKLEIYSEMAELNGYQDLGRSRLLLRADALECQQGEPILSAAVKESESQLRLQLAVNSLTDGEGIGVVEGVNGKRCDFPRTLQSVSARFPQTLVAQQDSYIEVQRSAHTEREKQYRLQSSRGNLLLEQEKQRSFEKQREELAGIHKLQSQVRQEQARWERDRERQLRDFSAQEARLQEREESIQQQKERLGQDRQELDRQRMDYQQDLERLLESQRAVDRERERLDQLQRKLLKQSSLGSTSDPGQVSGGGRVWARRNRSRSFSPSNLFRCSVGAEWSNLSIRSRAWMPPREARH